MSFGNDVVGGITLIRPAIQSANYVPGVSGWTINRDGSAEFATGTFRGPVVVIDPLTGNVLASIGANGNVSGQNLYATGDVIIGSLSVLAAITNVARGVVGFYKATTLPSPGVSGAYNNMAWVQFTADSTRMYHVSLSPIYWKNTNFSATVDLGHRLQLNVNAGGNTQILQTILALTSSPDIGSINVHQYFSPASSGPAVITWQCGNTNDTLVPVFIDPADFYIVVEDIGPKLVATGGTGSPAGTNTFTKRYTATVSDSYASPSGARENDASNLYIGQLSGRTNGSSENSLWIFPGATLRSDTAGASISSAKLWMYCTNSSGASGSSFISYVTNTSIPSTVPGTGSAGANKTNVWPVPGWASVDLTGSALTAILASANGVLLQPSGLTGSASWYGAGQTGFEPYIELTYTV
jgi:hypothetical protein